MSLKSIDYDKSYKLLLQFRYMFERKKVGLALGGGGARGLAHVGVLKVLEDYKIPIDMIAGTSMGAIIGTLYSAEPNAKKLEKEIIERDWKKIFDYTISRSGIIKGEKIEKFLREKLGGLSFKDMKIPLYITAYDLTKKREVVFDRGDVAKAVRASISVPGVFIPIENKGEVLVDGGVADIIPIDALKNAKADIIIAVNVDSIKEKKALYGQEAVQQKKDKNMPSIFKIINQTTQVMSSKASKLEIENEKADFVISPDLKDLEILDFSKTKKTIKIGERSAKKSIEELKQITEPNPFKAFLEELRNIVTPENTK